MSRPGAALLVAVAALGASVAVAALVPAPEPSAAAEPQTRRAPVVLAGAACPDPVAAGAVSTRVTMAATGDLSPGAGEPGAGAGRLTAVDGNGPVLASLDAAGTARWDAPSGASPLAAVATGGLAPGFAVAQVTRATAGDLRGLAGTPCVTPDAEFWFVGSGSVVGQRGRLYLTNPEDAPAVVDVTVHGPDGPIDAPGGRGVAVAAGGQEVLLLDALAPGVDRLAVHVQVRQGRVAAALRDQQVKGLDPQGSDWVPAAAAPARRVLLPGVPGGAGERRLQVLVPGESDAIVRVRLVGADGSFAPTGRDVLQATGGAVGDVDLAAATGGRPVAIELVSDVPITAGLLARVGAAAQRPELAYLAATDPLTPDQPGVVPDVRGGRSVRSTLALAAPGRRATVTVAPLPPATGDAVRVDVPRGRQVTLDLSRVSTQTGSFAVSVVPAPGSGPVRVSRELSEAVADGPLLTVSPVLPGTYAVPVPDVLGDLSTGLRPRD